MGEHASYRYSVTIASDDLAVVNCLRALAQFSQKDGNNRVPWGGPKTIDWQRDEKRVTFCFNDPKFRHDLLSEAARLLPAGSWQVVVMRDDDPALPRSR
jgi:hypothetical protein